MIAGLPFANPCRCRSRNAATLARLPHTAALQNRRRRVFRVLRMPPETQSDPIDIGAERDHQRFEGIPVPLSRLCRQAFEGLVAQFSLLVSQGVR